MSLSLRDAKDMAFNAGKSLSNSCISDRELKDIYESSLLCLSTCEAIGSNYFLATRYFLEITENTKTLAANRKIPYDDQSSFSVTPEKTKELVNCYIQSDKHLSDGDLFRLYECFSLCTSFCKGIGNTMSLILRHFDEMMEKIAREIGERDLYRL